MLAYRFKFQLVDKGLGHQVGPAIIGAGGVVYVATAGDASKATIQSRAGAALSNPLALTRGGAEFYCDSAEVDLFIMAPDGQFVTLWDVAAQEIHEIPVDRFCPYQCAIIPFAVGHQTGDATETDTGFDFALGSIVLPHPSVKVSVADAAITLEVGLKSSETAGDADGFLDAVSVATDESIVMGVVTNGANTMGALFETQDSANAGDVAPRAHVITGANATSITWTLLTAADTAEGYIALPYILPPYTGSGPRAGEA